MEKPESKKPEEKAKEIAEGVIRHFGQLSSSRGNWESHWEEIAERVMPSHSKKFSSKGQGTSGEKKTEQVFDSTAIIALERFGAILDALLTPRNQTWHKVVPSDPYLKKNREVRLYFEEVNRILFKYRYAPTANFAAQNQQNYQSLGAFGTGALFIDELHGQPGLRYRAMHLGEIYLAENHQGIIDTIIRHFPLTARQAVQKWGEKTPEKIREALKKNPEQQFFFLHCVKPRTEDFDPTRLDAKGMPFVSYYVSIDGKDLLSEGGYDSFPYSVSRYTQASNEVYGRGPAMQALPAIKTLNEEKKTVLKQGHRAVDPVLLAHDDGVLDSLDLTPGAVNFGGVDANGRALVQTLPFGNIAIGKDLMDDERTIINDAFLVRLFQVLVETPAMTATEVLERTREKGILLAPTVGRQQDEYLGPMITRELSILSRQGRLPPMPGILQEAAGEYHTEYDSPMSRAARAEEAAGIARTIEQTLNIVNVTGDPAPLDHFNFDQIVPDLAEIQGVPAKWMKDPRVIQQEREARQQQAEAQMAIQAAPGTAALVKAEAVARKKG